VVILIFGSFFFLRDAEAVLFVVVVEKDLFGGFLAVLEEYGVRDGLLEVD
jgi:hypothetical protein